MNKYLLRCNTYANSPSTYVRSAKSRTFRLLIFLQIRQKWRVRQNGGRRPSKWRQPTVEMAADSVSARSACFVLLVLAAHAAAIWMPLCLLLCTNRCRLLSSFRIKTQGRSCGRALLRLLRVVRLVVCAEAVCFWFLLLLRLSRYIRGGMVPFACFIPRLSCLVFRYCWASVLARWGRTNLFVYLSSF